MAPWLIWVVLAAVLAGAEVLTLTLVLGLLAVAALVGAAVDLLGGGVPLQVAAFAVTSVALVGAVRPLAKRHLRPAPSVPRTGIAALTGAPGLVLEPVDGQDGRVKVGGEVWSARSYDDTRIEAGRRVEVVRIEGATAVVLETETPWRA